MKRVVAEADDGAMARRKNGPRGVAAAAGFCGAHFGGDARFDEAVAVSVSHGARSHVWPLTWVLESDPEGQPGWGRLVRRPKPREPMTAPDVSAGV